MVYITMSCKVYIILSCKVTDYNRHSELSLQGNLIHDYNL